MRLIYFVLLLIVSLSAKAVDVIAYWSTNQEPVAQYVLNVGSTPTDSLVQSTTPASFAIISNLVAGQTYYFSLCARNVEGYESNPTDPIPFTIPVPTATLRATWNPNNDPSQNISYQLSVGLDGQLVTNVSTTGTEANLPGMAIGRSYSFSIVARNDEGQVSNPSDVVVFVVPDVAPIDVNTNTPPIATSRSLKTTVNTPLSVVLRGYDPDGDPIQFSIRTQPKNGTITGTPPNLRYTPKLDYVGLDSFTFTVSDAVFTSSPATVSLSVKTP